MNFIRRIVNSDSIDNIISLPEELKNQYVEILIFPIKEMYNKPKQEFKPEEYSGLLHIDNIEHEIQTIRNEWEHF